MGTEGAAAATMRATCREAALTERYFYESFANRDELLVAVLDDGPEPATGVPPPLLTNPPEASPLRLIDPVPKASAPFATVSGVFFLKPHSQPLHDLASLGNV